MEITIKNYEYDSETGEITLDLDNFSDDIELYAERFLGMTDEICEDCDDCLKLKDYDTDELEEELRYRGKKHNNLFYPNNSLRISDAYTTLLDNIENVPVEEIEKLIEKYKLL